MESQLRPPLLLALAAWAAIALPGLAHAAGPRLAVFGIEDKDSGLAPEALEKLTDLLAVRMAEEGYAVVPRAQLRKRQKQGGGFRACFDEACQQELGLQVGADKALATRVMRIGDTCHVSGTLQSLRLKVTERAGTAEASCAPSALAAAIGVIAGKLSTRRTGAPWGGDSPAPQTGAGGVIVTQPRGGVAGRVKLSDTRVRFATREDQHVFRAELATADGRTYTCPEVRVTSACNLPRLAEGQARLVVMSSGLGTYSRGVELEDDQELWVYNLETLPKDGAVVAMTFGGLGLAAGVALTSVGLALDYPGMTTGGVLSGLGGGAVLALGLYLPWNVHVDRDDYDTPKTASRPAPAEASSVALRLAPGGAAVVGSF